MRVLLQNKIKKFIVDASAYFLLFQKLFSNSEKTDEWKTKGNIESFSAKKARDNNNVLIIIKFYNPFLLFIL